MLSEAQTLKTLSLDSLDSQRLSKTLMLSLAFDVSQPVIALTCAPLQASSEAAASAAASAPAACKPRQRSRLSLC